MQVIIEFARIFNLTPHVLVLRDGVRMEPANASLLPIRGSPVGSTSLQQSGVVVWLESDGDNIASLPSLPLSRTPQNGTIYQDSLKAVLKEARAIIVEQEDGASLAMLARIVAPACSVFSVEGTLSASSSGDGTPRRRAQELAVERWILH